MCVRYRAGSGLLRNVPVSSARRPCVSVVVPNHNHRSYLTQRIDSILGQSFQDLELILLDDCSVDGSREVMEGYREDPRVSHVVYNDGESRGTFKQWRTGIDLAAGELVWLAESDDHADPEFLAVAVERLDADPRVGVTYCQSHSCDGEGRVLGDWLDHTARFEPNLWESDFVLPGTEAVQRYFPYLNPIPNASAVVFRRSVYDQIPDAIDTEMTLNGDWFLWIKLLERSDLSFASAPLNHFRQHLERGSHANIDNHNNVKEFYVLLSYLDSRGHLTVTQRKQLRGYLFAIWHKQAGPALFRPWSPTCRNVGAASRRFDPAIGLRKVWTGLLVAAGRHEHPKQLAEWPPRS